MLPTYCVSHTVDMIIQAFNVLKYQIFFYYILQVQFWEGQHYLDPFSLTVSQETSEAPSPFNNVFSSVIRP